MSKLTSHAALHVHKICGCSSQCCRDAGHGKSSSGTSQVLIAHNICVGGRLGSVTCTCKLDSGVHSTCLRASCSGGMPQSSGSATIIFKFSCRLLHIQTKAEGHIICKAKDTSSLMAPGQLASELQYSAILQHLPGSHATTTANSMCKLNSQQVQVQKHSTAIHQQIAQHVLSSAASQHIEFMLSEAQWLTCSGCSRSA